MKKLLSIFGIVFTCCLTGLAQTNQAPTIPNRPATITVNEDALFTFSGANLLSVADADAGSSNLLVTMSVTGSGILRLANTGGLFFASGANASSSMSYSGTLANINTSLNGMTYSNAPNANGAFSFNFTINDLGHNGLTGPKSSNVVIGITVNPVNDRPVISLPGTASVAEEGQIPLAITLSDVDSGEGVYTIQFSMSATNGVFTLASTNNLTFTAGTPVITTGNVIVITNATFQGSLANMNTALAGTVYLPRLNVNGGDTIVLTANDFGSFGSGGALSSNITRAITITAVNDRPELSIPSNIALNENDVAPVNLGGAVSDVDAIETPGSGMSVSLAVTNGVLNITPSGTLAITAGANGSTSMTITGALSDVDVALATLTYTPTPFVFGADNLNITVSDLGHTGSGGTLTTNGVILLIINEVNYAPQFDGSAVLTLTGINEDNMASAGNTVAQILATGGTPISDIDPGSLEGIAVIGADTTGGAWQYSTNAGVSFANFGPVLDNAATLLNPAAIIRFVPNADYNGTNTITFRAWDQFSGANGDTSAVAGLNGGNTAFSTNFLNATIIVAPLNDAPVVVNAADFIFPDQLEDDFLPVGTAVSNLLASLGGTQVTDVDGDLVAIAVTATDLANGVWEISTNGGASYVNVGVVSAASARLLAPDALIRFIPTANFFGSSTIGFRGWDQTAGTNTGFGNTTVNGGTTAFSALIATGRVVVLDVNEAPLLNSGATMTLSPIQANDFTSAGDTVAAIIATAGNPITDSDVGDPEGFAVVDVDDQFGLWQFSTDAGANWNILGPVSSSSATLLGETSLVRFIPLPNFSGPATITVHAWDQSSGADGLGGVDASTTGGSTAFSTNNVDVTITVVSTNTAPVLDNSGEMVLTSLLQDNTNSPGDSVVVIVASAGGDRITDADPGALEGLAVIETDNSNGAWQYSINAGATWIPFGTVADSDAVLLDQDGLIRFVPNGGFAGTATVVFRAWDQSSLFVSGATGVNASVNGGTTPFSSAIETARVDVIALGVNVAPNLNNAGDMKLPDIFQNNFTNTGDTVGGILASDIVNAATDLDLDPIGVAVIAADFSNGVWQYSINAGSTWNALNNISSTLAVLLDSSALIRFVPNANFNGAAGTITIRAWDQSDNLVSGSTGVDTSINGGTSAFSAQTETVRIEVVPMADLIISKVALTAPVPGAMVTYLITVTNQGPSDATNVVVNDTLPPEVTPTGLITTNFTTIFAGGSKSFTVTVEIPSALRGSLTNIASVTSELIDFTPANATITNVTALTPVADLVLVVSNRTTQAPALSSLTYFLSVTNKGPSDALSVTVTNLLPASATFQSASTGGVFSVNTVTFGPLLLPVGASSSFTIRVSTPNTINANLTNTAVAASAESDPVASNNTAVTVTKVISGTTGADFDGDGKGDAASFNSSLWSVRGSTAGSSQFTFGFPGVLPAVGDYDGDGKWDSAVFHPASGTWYLFRSQLGFTTTQFGFAGTLPVPADYDGDGRTDIAVYDPPSGLWYLFRSQLGFTTTQFGYIGAKPVPADFDGDGRDDVAVYDATAGLWSIFRSTLGFQSVSFGFPGTVAVPGDYDGDGKADVAVYHDVSGTWYIFRSQLGFTTTVFGFAGTLPATGDYDGDGKSDLGVYDPVQARWYLMKSTQGFETFVQGAPGGRPITVPVQ